MDSHADTTVLGCKCAILAYIGKKFKVSPYSDEYESIQHVQVVTGVTAWIFPHSRETFILIFNKALCIGENLNNTLVNPNQMRHHRINVQDKPCMKKPMLITCPEEDVTVPLYMSDTSFVTITLHQQRNS